MTPSKSHRRKMSIGMKRWWRSKAGRAYKKVVGRYKRTKATRLKNSLAVKAYHSRKDA